MGAGLAHRRIRWAGRQPASRVSFACHGTADPAKPSGSLLLHDHDTGGPVTVAALALVTPEHAQLVYLCACRTAPASAPEPADEASLLT
jgi:CHAT domain-containing protein